MRNRIILLVFMLVVFLTFSCKEKTTIRSKQDDTAISIDQKIATNQSYRLGDLTEYGWQVKIDANTFETDEDIVVNRPDESEYVGSDNLIGSGIQVRSRDGYELQLNKPVSLFFKIPESKIFDINTVDDYAIAYFNKSDGWKTYLPTSFDIGNRLIEYKTGHFSIFFVKTLTDAQKVKIYSERMALDMFEVYDNLEQYTNILNESFNGAFEKIGLTDKTLQGYLMQEVVSNVDFGKIMIGAQKGDVSGLSGVLAEKLAKACLNQAFHRKDAAALIGAITDGALNVSLNVNDAKYEDALKVISEKFILYLAPQLKIFKVGEKAISIAISSWKDGSMERLYNNYKNSIDSNGRINIEDFEYENLLTGGGSAYIHRLANENKLSEKEVTKILLQKIEKRYKNEKRIQAIALENEKIVKGFEDDGLLKRDYFGFRSTMQIEDRLADLFRIRNHILSIFGGKMPTQYIGQSSQANMNEAIRKFIKFRNEGNRNGFYIWLAQKYGNSSNEPLNISGYEDILEDITPSSVKNLDESIDKKQESKSDTYVWKFVKTITNDWESKLNEINSKNAVWKSDIIASGSSVTFTSSVAKTVGDTWAKAGMSQSGKVGWSSFNKPVLMGNEEVSLDLWSQHVSRSHDNFGGIGTIVAQYFSVDKNNNISGSATYFKNESGKSMLSSTSSNNYQSMSETVKAKIGSGRKEGDRMAIRVSASNGRIAVETWYIYKWNKN